MSHRESVDCAIRDATSIVDRSFYNPPPSSCVPFYNLQIPLTKVVMGMEERGFFRYVLEESDPISFSKGPNWSDMWRRDVLACIAAYLGCRIIPFNISSVSGETIIVGKKSFRLLTVKAFTHYKKSIERETGLVLRESGLDRDRESTARGIASYFITRAYDSLRKEYGDAEDEVCEMIKTMVEENFPEEAARTRYQSIDTAIGMRIKWLGEDEIACSRIWW